MSDLLIAQQPQLAALAATWLQSGAEAFSVWTSGRLLASWPANYQPQAPALRAPIELGGHVFGELRLDGMPCATAAEQLRAEAGMVARMIELEADLQQMTAELIDTQDQLVAMYDLTQATRSHLSIVETLRGLAYEAARLVKTDGAALLLGPAIVQHPSDLVDEQQLQGYYQQVQRRERELILSGTDHQLPGVDSVCMLPIWINGSIGAALCLLNHPGGFSAPDLKLARAIAEHAGAQLEHALLHQERLAQARLNAEMEVARRVQLQMLPQARPRVPTLDIYAESRPALQVGGDFYDFVAQPDRPLLLLLGDVAGKGISAALIMGMIHAVCSSASRFMPSASPAAVLARANEDLYDDLTRLDAFVTTFAAQYDQTTRTLRYANAGHAPVIFRPHGGSARLMEPDGVPIGVLPVSLCENYTLDFGPGDLLVVTTDGFNEAGMTSGALFGYERLLQLVDGFADQPAQVIARGLYDAVEEFAAGQPQDDDQTLIIVKGVAP